MFKGSVRYSEQELTTTNTNNAALEIL